MKTPSIIPPTNDPPIAPPFTVVCWLTTCWSLRGGIWLQTSGDARFTFVGHCLFSWNDCSPIVMTSGSSEINSLTWSMSTITLAEMLLELLITPLTSRFPLVEQLTDMLSRFTGQSQEVVRTSVISSWSNRSHPLFWKCAQFLHAWLSDVFKHALITFVWHWDGSPLFHGTSERWNDAVWDIYRTKIAN